MFQWILRNMLAYGSLYWRIYLLILAQIIYAPNEFWLLFQYVWMNTEGTKSSAKSNQRGDKIVNANGQCVPFTSRAEGKRSHPILQTSFRLHKQRIKQRNFKN